MIMLTRLSGSRFALNADLIERIDSTPDTVVTLTAGTKYVVAESVPEVIAAVRAFRSEIVALSGDVQPIPAQAVPAGHLAPVTVLPGTVETASRTPEGEEL